MDTVPNRHTLLVDRKTLSRMLGGVSVSHILRLEKYGRLAQARVAVGPRMVRYDLGLVREMVERREIF